MRSVSATTVSYSRIKTKKDLKQAVKDGFNAEVRITDTMLGTGILGIFDEWPDGIYLTVANPTRTWYATVKKNKDGKPVVT
jgi:hypothetical protein